MVIKSVGHQEAEMTPHFCFKQNLLSVAMVTAPCVPVCPNKVCQILLVQHIPAKTLLDVNWHLDSLELHILNIKC